jgi:hypothetical protein
MVQSLQRGGSNGFAHVAEAEFAYLTTEKAALGALFAGAPQLKVIMPRVFDIQFA